MLHLRVTPVHTRVLRFASDADLARHKRSATHMRQHRVALALQKCQPVAPAPLPAEDADHQQVKHGPPTLQSAAFVLGDA